MKTSFLMKIAIIAIAMMSVFCVIGKAFADNVESANGKLIYRAADGTTIPLTPGPGPGHDWSPRPINGGKSVVFLRWGQGKLQLCTLRVADRRTQVLRSALWGIDTSIPSRLRLRVAHGKLFLSDGVLTDMYDLRGAKLPGSPPAPRPTNAAHRLAPRLLRSASHPRPAKAARGADSGH